MTTKEKLLAHLASLPVHRTTAPKLAKAIGASESGVTTQLHQLIGEGKLAVIDRQHGPGRGTVYAYRHGFDGVPHPEHALAVVVHS